MPFVNHKPIIITFLLAMKKYLCFDYITTRVEKKFVDMPKNVGKIALNNFRTLDGSKLPKNV